MTQVDLTRDQEVDLIAHSGFLDLVFYQREADRSFVDEREAALHYIDGGAAKGLRPCVDFDTAYYWLAYPECRAAAVTPLTHFLTTGRRDRRRTCLFRAARAAKPRAPSPEQWQDVFDRLDRSTGGRGALLRGGDSSDLAAPTLEGVDIIVPVYRGFDDTLACLFSIATAASNSTYRIIVIDDASPEPRLSEALDDLARQGLITLLKNERNLGFVRTVNRGLAATYMRDVILLNADTIVYDHWIDRLAAHADGDESIATITPLSNNATIMSYPHKQYNNFQSLAESYEDIDRVAADVNKGLSIEVPTGVGFCMYITRRALDSVGGLDERLFGRGYGEENDFSMRCALAGFRNVAALDVFVRHTGEVSFGANAGKDRELGVQRLNRVHTSYLPRVYDFIRRDPLRDGRGRLDIARFAGRSGGRGILMLDHGMGGGIGRHVSDLTEDLREEGVASLVWRPKPGREGLAFHDEAEGDFPNLPDTPWEQLSDRSELLRTLGFEWLHIHSMIGVPEGFHDALVGAARQANLKLAFTLHDFVPVCPRTTMIDWSGTHCATPSVRYCQECVDRIGSRFGHVSMADWRRNGLKFLNRMDRIFAPSEDVKRRFMSLGDIRTDIIVRPHRRTRASAAARVAPRADSLAAEGAAGGTVRTVGVIGAIGPHKGSRILMALAGDASLRKLPMRFVIYGFSDRQELGRFRNVKVLGEYHERELPSLLRTEPCDVLLYPSVWPETFCYTLDWAFETGVWPVVLGDGAPADRVRRVGFGAVAPIALAYAPSAFNDFLLRQPLTQCDPQFEGDRVWQSAHDLYA